MPGLVRFGVSLDSELLKSFDEHITKKDYPTRSKAIEDLIREDLTNAKCAAGNEDVAGVVTMVYDHHRRELVNNLLDVQHDCQGMIISTQHVHLTHNNCLEVIAVKGKAGEIQRLAERLKAEKGVKHVSLNVACAGE